MNIPGVNTDMGLWWPTVVGWVLLAAAFTLGWLWHRHRNGGDPPRPAV